MKRRWCFLCLLLMFVLTCGGCMGTSVKPAQQGGVSTESEMVHVFGRIRLIEDGREIVDYTQGDKVYLEVYDVLMENHAGLIEVGEDGTYSVILPPGKYSLFTCYKGKNKMSPEYKFWPQQGFSAVKAGQSYYLGTVAIYSSKRWRKTNYSFRKRVPGKFEVSDELASEETMLKELGLRRGEVVSTPMARSGFSPKPFTLGVPWDSLLTILQPVLSNAHMFVH